MTRETKLVFPVDERGNVDRKHGKVVGGLSTKYKVDCPTARYEVEVEAK